MNACCIMFVSIDKLVDEINAMPCLNTHFIPPVTTVEGATSVDEAIVEKPPVTMVEGASMVVPDNKKQQTLIHSSEKKTLTSKKIGTAVFQKQSKAENDIKELVFIKSINKKVGVSTKKITSKQLGDTTNAGLKSVQNDLFYVPTQLLKRKFTTENDVEDALIKSVKDERYYVPKQLLKRKSKAENDMEDALIKSVDELIRNN